MFITALGKLLALLETRSKLYALLPLTENFVFFLGRLVTKAASAHKL